MSEIETIVKGHYGIKGLGQRILDGLAAKGHDTDNLTIEDLAQVDEFHIGGRKATEYIISKMGFRVTDHVLDVGCGIGGAARTIAAQTGCTVSGIDLTEEYIKTANLLTERTGLTDRVNFRVCSALDMPHPNNAFDAAVTIHAAMNISERDTLYREIARVLKPGGRLCIYDIMKRGTEPVQYPVPWAMSEASSHLVLPEEMGELLLAAGFDLLEVEDRTEIALDYFKERMAQAAAMEGEGPDPLSPQLVMGETVKEKIANIRFNVTDGRIAPVLLIAGKKRTA